MGFEILTKEEAASRAKISPRFLHKQIKDGIGPATFQLGRRVLVRSGALQAWLEKRSTSSHSAEAA